jgi:hypothetical protein
LSIARGLLINVACDHRDIVLEVQRALAEAWKIDDGDVMRREEFKELVVEINEAVALTHPDWVSLGRPTPRGH